MIMSARKYCSYLALHLLTLLLSSHKVDSQPGAVPSPSPQPYSTPGTCPARSYFRTSNLTCTVCPVNQTVSEDGELLSVCWCIS